MYCVAIAFTVVLLVAPAYTATNVVLKEIDFISGTAGSSSIYSNSFSPTYAFQSDTKKYWHSGRPNQRADAFPHLIWYRFHKAYRPGRVSFRPRMDGGCGNGGYWCGATKWQFIGTNDAHCNAKSAWTILCEDLSGNHFERMTQSKYCDVEKSLKGSFRCLGISVLDSSFPGTYSCVSMGGIKMWELQ